MQDLIVVNMGDCKVVRGKQKLITRDLGSCVAIAMRDAEKGIGGLLHIMLPMCENRNLLTQDEMSKYADTGIEQMIRQMVYAGASREKLTAKLAGAAHIIKTEYVPISKDISTRNLQAVKKNLEKYHIPIISMEVEDDYPRTVVFEPETGIVQIKTIGKEDRYI